MIHDNKDRNIELDAERTRLVGLATVIHDNKDRNPTALPAPEDAELGLDDTVSVS